MPLRASELPMLLRCPRSLLLKHLAEDTSGQAADTGSAVHKAVAALHTHAKSDVAAALKAMEQHLPEYPLADLGTAEMHFRLYAKDPRNKEAKVILCEEKIKVTLQAPEGHSEAVEIHGTLDQVREEGGRLVVCDVKTGGSYEGDEMLSYYAAQLAAYQVGAAKRLGKHVASSCIIRTKDYLKTDRKKQPKPGPVFWNASWTWNDSLALLDEVRRVVGDVRSGRISTIPSPDNCRWCPGGGIGNCLRRKLA
jgi:RecB family exonuclease